MPAYIPKQFFMQAPIQNAGLSKYQLIVIIYRWLHNEATM